MSSDDSDFWTTWGREFCEAVRPLAPHAIGQDAFEVAARALGGAPAQRDVLALDEAGLRCFSVAAAEVLGLNAVDIDLIRKAVEATRLHWSDHH